MRSQLLDAQMDTDVDRTTSATTSYPVSAQLQGLYETLNILAGGIETLNNDGQRLTNESLQCQIKLQKLAEEFSQVKLSAEESHGFLEGVKQNQDILNQDVESLKEIINDMQYVSYDGTFVWKTTNFQEKMTDAQSERQTLICSPPFYSSPTGYKMRAGLYLNGDGNAHCTHMSLFFVLIRSVNDPILKFPFNYKVTFCLYDQTPAQRHIIDTFRADIRSSSFQRARSDMNIASGISKFFPLEMIQQKGNPYIREIRRKRDDHLNFWRQEWREREKDSVVIGQGLAEFWLLQDPEDNDTEDSPREIIRSTPAILIGSRAAQYYLPYIRPISNKKNLDWDIIYSSQFLLDWLDEKDTRIKMTEMIISISNDNKLLDYYVYCILDYDSKYDFSIPRSSKSYTTYLLNNLEDWITDTFEENWRHRRIGSLQIGSVKLLLILKKIHALLFTSMDQNSKRLSTIAHRC
ncbi:unnamed protein product [Rotaria sordida]|uniref:MATH domain-containing protein n=1 Tax=Rotaria sordida TaxID=392033 RepID=A0A813W674_9BILA|nr:unnamed protein product [Rotaria sordida]